MHAYINTHTFTCLNITLRLAICAWASPGPSAVCFCVGQETCSQSTSKELCLIATRLRRASLLRNWRECACMSVYLCVHVCICIIYIHIYIHTYIHTYIYIYELCLIATRLRRASLLQNWRECACMSVYLCVHVCMYNIYIYIYIYIHVQSHGWP